MCYLSLPSPLDLPVFFMKSAQVPFTYKRNREHSTSLQLPEIGWDTFWSEASNQIRTSDTSVGFVAIQKVGSWNLKLQVKKMRLWVAYLIMYHELMQDPKF